MILLTRLRVLILVLIAVGMAARAQTFTVTDPRYVSAKLFDSEPGSLITSMAADAVGNVYYIQTKLTFDGDDLETYLCKRSAIDNYATETKLHDLGFRVSGAFVTCAGSTVYFGENNTHNIYSIQSNGTLLDSLGTMTTNISDAKMVGGRLYLADNGTTLNTPTHTFIARYDLIANGANDYVLGNRTVLLDAANDRTGVFDTDGSALYYGASGEFVANQGIYALDIQGTIPPGGLTLPATKFGTTTTTAVGALAFGSGVDLWKDDRSSTNLLLFSRFNGGVSTIGHTDNGYTLRQLDFAETVGLGTLFLNVSDQVNYGSSIYRLAIPEPSCALTLLAGSSLFLRRRR